MKNTIKIIIGIVIAGAFFLGVTKAIASTPGGITVPQGGTGYSAIDQYAFLMGSGTLRLYATTTPTFLGGATFVGPTFGLRGTDLLSSTTERMNFGDYNLKQYAKEKAFLDKDVVGTKLSVVWIGDSLLNDGFADLVKHSLQSRYGNAGSGYQNLYYQGSLTAEATITFAGSWTSTRNLASSISPSISEVTSSDTATPGSITTVGAGDTYIIHYVKKSGGGIFEYNIDGGGFTSVDTSNASTVNASSTITASTNASHTIVIRVTSAGSSGVTINGIEILAAGINGVIMNNIGSGGATSGSWVGVDQTIFQANLRNLNPDTVFITLGTNDHTNNVTPGALSANLQTLINSVKSAVPLADVVLIASPDNGNAGTYSMLEYDIAQQDRARASNTGYVSLLKIMDSYANANSRGLMSETTHPNAKGYQLMANAVLNFLNQRNVISPVEYDQTTGYVGIGTTSPTVRLQVAGTIGPDSDLGGDLGGTTKRWGAIYGQTFSSAANSLVLNSDLNLVFRIGNVEKMRLSGANSSLGIGTTTPYAKLSVVGDVVMSNFYATSTTATSTISTGGFTVGTSHFVVQSSSGNVGIGTTSPYASFSVDGRGIFNRDIRVDYVTATSSTIASTFPYASTTALTVSGNAFFPGSGVWNSSGNVGIGSTTPTYKLGIDGSGEYVANIRNTGGGANGGLLITDASGGTTSYALRILTQTNTETFAVTNGGKVGIASSTPLARLGIVGIGNTTFKVFQTTSANGTIGVTIQDNGFTGIGTSTPEFPIDIFSTGTTTSRSDSNSTTRGACDIKKDSDGVGYTYITYNGGVQTVSTTPCN